MRALETERLDALLEMLAALIAACSATAAIGCALALLARGISRRRSRRAAVERYVVGCPDRDGAELYLLDAHGVRRLPRLQALPGRARARQRLVATSRRRHGQSRSAGRELIDMTLPDNWRETGFSLPVPVERHRFGLRRRRR
jgi:hypothetical protein